MILLAATASVGCEPVAPPPSSPPKPQAKVEQLECTECVVSPRRAELFLKATTTRPTTQASSAPTTKPQDESQKMLSQALKEVRPAGVMVSEQITVEIVSRSPEGTKRELIQCNSSLQLIDTSNDRMMRKGDEIVLPCRANVPAGLERPASLATGAE